MSATPATAAATWFYESNGQRKGPISEAEVRQLIQAAAISRKTPVWRQGLSAWTPAGNTELHTQFGDTRVAPLTGRSVGNSIVWTLAFAPLIGNLIEWVIAGVIHQGNVHAIQAAMKNSPYWLVTLALNIALSMLDEKRLQNAGHDTSSFKGWTWVVPVYLYQRAKTTRQNLAYFIVWITCFALVLLA